MYVYYLCISLLKALESNSFPTKFGGHDKLAAFERVMTFKSKPKWDTLHYLQFHKRDPYSASLTVILPCVKHLYRPCQNSSPDYENLCYW